MVAPVEALAAMPESLSDVMQHRCSALELPPSTRCGTAVLSPATLFEKAAEAYARMMSSDAQFRVVLTM
jgi:hypothetical protein